MTEAVKQKINFFDQVSNNNSNNLKSAHINKQSFGAREEMNSFGNYNSVPIKNSSKDALGIIFQSRRTNITLDKLKTTSDEYIFDLTNTWELNLELILNFSSDMFKKPAEQQAIKNKINNIKTFFTTKKNKRQDFANCKGKLLIEKQIIEEHKRKIEENYEMYKDQIREMEENVDNKEEYIKIFEKKLREVEIYVQKNTKNLMNTRFDIYKNFIMNDFINENTDLLRKKDHLELERVDYINQVNEAKEENNKIKMQSQELESEEVLNFVQGDQGKILNTYSDNNNKYASYGQTDDKKMEIIISSRINNKDSLDNEYGSNNTNTNTHTTRNPRHISIYNYNNMNIYNSKKLQTEKLKNNKKLKNVLQAYNNHIKLIETKNKLLKVQMKDLYNKFLNKNKLKIMIQNIKKNDQNENRESKLDQTFDKGDNQFNIVENANNVTFIEKSNVNLDITRKLATYMDFSAVLNKRDETNFHDLSANKTSDNIFSAIHHNHDKNIWDVSCIEKN